MLLGRRLWGELATSCGLLGNHELMRCECRTEGDGVHGRCCWVLGSASLQSCQRRETWVPAPEGPYMAGTAQRPSPRWLQRPQQGALDNRSVQYCSCAGWKSKLKLLRGETLLRLKENLVQPRNWPHDAAASCLSTSSSVCAHFHVSRLSSSMMTAYI